jgi:hypothetical protein
MISISGYVKKVRKAITIAMIIPIFLEPDKPLR